MKKYGQENFTIELIEECDLNIIYETEKKYVELYNSYDNGLNSTFGGEGCLGYTHSPEIRKKISENTKNGNSHRGKTYKDLYGDREEEERKKRQMSVKQGWDKMSDKDKENRVNNIKENKRRHSKYGIDLVKEMKEKISKGITSKEFKNLYPQTYENFFYDLKNGTRWSDL